MIEPRNPFETADDSESDLQEKVSVLLEDAGIETSTCDAIMVLIENAERVDLGAPRRRLTLKVTETILGFDPSNHHNAAHCPYCCGN